MSENHLTFLQNAEAKALEGYLAALQHVRDDIEHDSSKTIDAVQSWIDNADTKLKELQSAPQKETGADPQSATTAAAAPQTTAAPAAATGAAAASPSDVGNGSDASGNGADAGTDAGSTSTGNNAQGGAAA